MTKQVQLRRGTTAEHSVFTGALAEVTVDTNKFVAIVHDGVTAGGFPLVGTAATQQILNKSGVGIGTSSLTSSFQVVGDASVAGNIQARSITVRYNTPITRTGVASAFGDTRITGISTNDIRVGYGVSGDRVLLDTTVTGIGIGTVYLDRNTTDTTTTASGVLLSSNGTTILGINTNNITVGFGVSGTGVVANTTVVAIGTESYNGVSGRITLSQNTSGTLGITTRTGSVSAGSTIISGITTTSLAYGDNVVYTIGVGTAGVTYTTTIVTVGVNSVTVATGIGTTNASQSIAFSRNYPYIFGQLGIGVTLTFTDLQSGQVNADVINVNNIAIGTATFNQAVASVNITNTNIENAGITNLNSANQNTTNLNISGIQTVNTSYINVGVGTTVGISSLTFNQGFSTALTSTYVKVSDGAAYNVGINTLSGTYSGLNTTFIGLTTSGLLLGDIVSGNYISTTGIVTVTGIGSTGITISVASTSPSGTNFANVTIVRSTIAAGIATFANLNVVGYSTFIGVTTTTTFNSQFAGITTASIGVATITNANLINAGVTTSVTDKAYINVGIGTTVSSSTLTATNLYYASGIATNTLVTGVSTLGNVLAGRVPYNLVTTSATSSGIVTVLTGVTTSGLIVGQYVSGSPFISTSTTVTQIGVGQVYLSQATTSGFTTSLTFFSYNTIDLDVSGNARVSGILTVGVSSITLKGSDATISGVNTISTKQVLVSDKIVANDSLSYTYTGTLSVASTTIIVGVTTFGIYPLYTVSGPNISANTYVLSIGSTSVTLNTPATNVGLVTTNFTFTDGTTGLSTIPILKGRNLNYTGIATLNETNISVGKISSITASYLDMSIAGIATIQNLNVLTGVTTYLTGTNLRYTGISTLANVVIGGGTTDLVVNGNARVTGVLTIGQGSVSINGNTSGVSGISTLQSVAGYVTNFYSNTLGVNTSLSFIGINTSTGLDQSVTFKLSQVGIATNYTLVLPPTRGKDGQVLSVDGFGNLGFTTNPGGLYQNRLYVSSTNGSDANDGKTKPLQTIKRAAQLASFQSFVLPAGRYIDAANLLTKNRTFIQSEVVGFITATYPGITTDANWYADKCYRDVGYIVDAIAYDLTYNGNSKSVASGLAYYSGVGTSYVDGEKIQTVDAFKHIVDISKYIINNVTIPDAGGRYDDASSLLTKNRSYIQREVVGFITATYPALLSDPNYSSTKCLRDVGYIVDALAYDIKYGGNMKSVGAGVSYWSGVGTSYLPGEQIQTVAAFTYIAGISSYIINNVQNPVSYQPTAGVSSVSQVFDLTIAYDPVISPAGYASTACANVRSTINTLVGIITTIVGQGTTAAPAITRPVGLYQTSVYQTYDTSIAFDATANPTSYASTSCANVQSTIATLVGIVTTIVGVGSTAAPTIVNPTTKSTPIAIFAEAGEYIEDNPIILYEDVAVIGDNLRNTIIRPKNSGKDLFRVRNGCYVTQFAMKDNVDTAGVPQFAFDNAVAFDDPSDPYTDRTGYAVKTAKPVITRSPYIQNCSILSFLGANGILVDGSKVLSPNKAPISAESENPVAGEQPEFGKSMVAAAFTMVSFGGIGWRVINDGYSQVVSCFQIFCRYGSLAQSGGYLSITNSATNFGLYSLRSQGFSQNSFKFDRGRIADTGTSGGLQTLTVIGLGRVNQDLYILRFFDDALNDRTSNFKPLTVISEFNAATAVDTSADTFNITSHPFSAGDSVIYYGDEQAVPKRIIGGLVSGNQYYIIYISATQFKVAEDSSLTRVVDLTSASTGINTFVKNNQDFYVKSVIATHNSYQKVSLASTSSTLNFISGKQISQTVVGGTAVGFALTFNSATRELIVSVESSAGTRRNFQITNGTTNLNILDHSGTPVSIGVTNVTGITTYYTTNFKVDSTTAGTVITGISSLPQNYRCHFHRPSTINANSHAWEYSGSGTDYNALPQNGGLSVDGTEQVQEFGGRVYSTGTNELGDFKVGNFITAFNRTGNIIFNNTVTIGTLDSLRLSLSGGTAITEFSTDVGLGDNEVGGPKDFRVSTQLATRSFLNNRLGSFIDKNVSTNAVPGAVVQLNAAGQINADLIPPKVVNYYTSSVDGGRIYLVNKIPAANLISGDTVVEPTNSWVLISDVYGQYLILNNTYTYNWLNGDTVTSVVSGGSAIGIVTAPTYVGYGTTGLVKGVALTLNGLSGGSGYTNAGIYTGVTLDSATGIGTSITATVTVSAAGTVSNVAIYTGGRYYATGDVLTINDPTKIGGRSGGANFSISVNTVETRLYLTLTNNTKFPGSFSLPDYISDRNAGTLSTHVGLAVTTTFTPTDTSIGGALDFTNSRFVIPGHKYADADPVVYSSQGGNAISPLVEGNTYYAKKVGISSVELYTNYGLGTKVTILSSGTGTHKFTRLGINTSTNQLTFVNHPFSQGDSVRITGSVPNGLTPGNYYFIGSKTTNTFTLHTVRADALLSTNGLLYNTIDITAGITTSTIVPSAFDSQGVDFSSDQAFRTNTVTATPTPVTFDAQSGPANDITTLTSQNVTYSSSVNTSSSILSNWALLATTTIDAANVVSGIFATSRLASGVANNQTFVRGDSTWAKVVTSVGIGTTQPFGVTYTSADLAPLGVGINTYYGNVQLTLNRVQSTTDLYSTLGVARFKTSTFGIASDGSVYIKTLSQGGDVDAATLNGNAASYYLDINNTTGSIPITRGGTGQSGLPSAGAILIGNGSSYNLTTTPTFTASVTFNGGATGAINLGANGDILFNNSGTWTGEKASKIQFYNNNLYLQYTGSLIGRNSSGSDVFTVDSSGNTVHSGTCQGTRLISTIASGTAPLTVTSTTVVANLNASFLQGYQTATANTVNSIVLRDGSGNFSAGTITATFSGSISGGSVAATTGTFSNYLRTLEQVRATGWYGTPTGSSYTGLAAELGVSSGQAYLICYNRDTSAYGTLNIQSASTTIQLPASGSTISVTGNLTSNGTVQGTQLISTIGTGTAPLSVTSTTQVNNLNVTYLQGYQTATANTGSTIVLRDGSGNFSAGTVTANLNGVVTSTGGQLGSYDLRTISPSSMTAGRLQFGFTSWTNNNSAPYADYLHLRSYTDSSGGSDNLIMFKKSGLGMRIWQQSFGSASAYSSYVDVLDSGSYSSYTSWTSLGTFSVTNSTVTNTGTHLTLANPSGSQTVIGFTYGGTAKQSIRGDSTGNLILNASSNNFYFNNDLGSSTNFLNVSTTFMSVSGANITFGGTGTFGSGGSQVVVGGGTYAVNITGSYNYTGSRYLNGTLQFEIPAQSNVTDGAVLRTRYNPTNSRYEPYWTHDLDSNYRLENPYQFAFRYIINRGYTVAGYQNSSPWRNGNRTVHASETTLNLGDVIDNSCAYIQGSHNGINMFVYAASNNFTGVSNATCSMSMITETNRGTNGNWNLATSRNYCGTFVDFMGNQWYSNSGRQRAYITSGQGNTDRHDLNTETMLTGVSGSLNVVASASGEYYAWVSGGGNVNQRFDFSAETYASWSTYSTAPANADGYNKHLGTRIGMFYASENTNTNNVITKRRDDTGVILRSGLTKPEGGGEENFHTGMDKGFSIGNYNGGQNNNAWQIRYAMDAWIFMDGTLGYSKGVPGRSSAATAIGGDQMGQGVTPTTYMTYNASTRQTAPGTIPYGYTTGFNYYSGNGLTDGSGTTGGIGSY